MPTTLHPAAGLAPPAGAGPQPRPVALLFPGQGAQQPRMAAGLYGHCDVFTDVLDTAFRLLGRDGARIRADWLDDSPAELFDDVTRAQPMLYAVGYALGRLVESWGVEPAALLGHSVGEMVAATLAGVLDFPDGISLIRDRMQIFADTPPGLMLAVAASAEDVAPHLAAASPDDVAIAAVNGPRQVLVAGLAGPVDAVRRSLRASGVTCRLVSARQAFHSPVVADAARRSAAAWQATPLRAPRMRMYSAYLGDVLPDERGSDPAFWARQPVATVFFGPTLDRMLADGDYLIVEAGAGRGLSALARRHPAVTSGRSAVIALLPARAGRPEDDRRALREAAAKIRAEGHAIAAA